MANTSGSVASDYVSHSHAETIRMHPYRTHRLVAAAIALALIAPPSIWLARQYRQHTLNHALIAAITRSDASAVDTLLAAGADPNTRDTPQKQEPLLQRLKHILHQSSQGLDQAALMVALDQAPYGSRFAPTTLPIVKALLASGADANARDKYGDTPIRTLFWHRNGASSSWSHVENTQLLQALLSARANTEVMMEGEGTPLYHVTQFGETASARLLLDHGANPSPHLTTVRSPFLRSPLSWARHKHYTKIITILKAHGAKE